MPIILISFFATLFAFTASPLYLFASVSWCCVYAWRDTPTIKGAE